MQPEIGTVCKKLFTPEIRNISEQDRTIDFVASTEAKDRYGDVIRVNGWKLDNYMKNPVFLWAHKSNEPPIGKTVDISKEANPPALVQRIEFATKDVYPFADTVFQLYKGKFLRAVSVGFMPLSHPKRIADDEDRTTGWEYVDQELLELSAVPVPANQEALARCKGFGAEADLQRVFSAPASSVEEIYRDVIGVYRDALALFAERTEISSTLLKAQQSLSRIAVDLATDTMQQAALLRAAVAQREPDTLDVDDLLEQIRGSAARSLQADKEVNSIQQLGEALGVEKFSDAAHFRLTLGDE